MNILSIYFGLSASAAILKNNKLVAAVQEERFSRKKNDEAFPQNSIKFCLEKAKIKPVELDAVAVASYLSPFDDTIVRKSQWKVEDYLKEQQIRWKPFLIDKTDKKQKSLLQVFPEKIDLNLYPKNYWRRNYLKKNLYKNFLKDRVDIVANFLKMDKKKVHIIEHHKSHAYYSYYASSFRDEKNFALTIDGMGDGLNATVGLFDHNGSYKRFYKTNQCNIARIYRYMTLVLGMKPNEHEYKLMGLAPMVKRIFSKSFKYF